MYPRTYGCHWSITLNFSIATLKRWHKLTLGTKYFRLAILGHDRLTNSYMVKRFMPHGVGHFGEYVSYHSVFSRRGRIQPATAFEKRNGKWIATA